MTLKTIETRAVVSAQDKTGATFAQIADKLRRMETSAQRAGQVTSRVGTSIGAISPAAAKASAAIGLIGGAAVLAAEKGIHKLHEFATSIIDLGKEYDRLVRKQRAVLGISEKEQEPLIQQALHLGATTPFNDVKVLEAQTELIQRGIAKEFVQPIVEAASDFAQAMDIGLVEAARNAESAFFASGQHAKTAEQTQKDFGALISNMVKTSQVSGLKAEGLAQFYKFGLPSATAAHVSLPFYGAAGATMYRGGLPGEEGGVAMRSFMGSLLKPTASGMNVLDALGIRYSDYAHQGPMSAANLNQSLQRRLGRKLSKSGEAEIAGIMGDPEIAGDPALFTHAVARKLGAGLKPADAKKLADVVGDFWTASLANINIEGLMSALIKSNLSAAQGVNLFGGKQAGRFSLLSQNAPFFEEKRKEIAAAPPDLAKRQGEQVMAGFYGSMARLTGSWNNVITVLFRDFEPEMKKVADTGAGLEKAFVEMDPAARKLAEALGLAAVAAIGFQAAILGAKALDKAAGGGTWLGKAAGVASGALGIFGGLPAFAGAAGLTLLGAKPANAGEDEMARQRKFGEGRGSFRIEDVIPGSGRFAPSGPGGVRMPVAELRGGARLGIDMNIRLDPGLIADQIQKWSRDDLGVSMKP